ncbi:unnamed protein product [Nesidiocoris tenuis]|uniref:glutathione transferase n=1 Tax=Nesidiocoris tenuis TaxID=355587 RepID=A0A6H5GRY1_9HEMI|nr:unnamed protein product [Nesidiocoris tenuis]
MPVYKLTYFDVKALAEPIRMLLTYMGHEFEDVRLSFEEWSKIKSSSPFGKLPTLEIDGKVITQSAAICRYLGREAKLAGDNPMEDMNIDIIVDTFTDFRKDISAFHHEADPEKKEQKRQTLLKETVPYYFERFDRIVKENNGYLANGKLSWVDIYMLGLSDTVIAQLNDDVFEKYENLSQWKNRIASIPSMKTWIAKRPVTRL